MQASFTTIVVHATRPAGRHRLEEAAMSQVRVHNFSISLDGFGTGAGITSDAPLDHAGERLHEWVFAPDLHSALKRRFVRHIGTRPCRV
jgi:hypothetical protein